jgi:SAM-dependent methyltransferase
LTHSLSFENGTQSDTGSAATPLAAVSPEWIAEYTRGRRHPRHTQYNYLHLQRLLDDLEYVLRTLPHPTRDVVDIFCGTRPYDDLLPEGARCVGLDVDERYGGADVVSTEFLPFDDACFDLAMCLQGFHYVEDPRHGVEEIRRVLRPGRTALITTPFVWGYNPTILERRFTGPELRDLFAGWDDVRVVQNGGRGISWAFLTGSIIQRREAALPRWARRLIWPLFSAAYLGVNRIGALIERGEDRGQGASTLPVNLMLIARRPEDG